MIGCIATFFPLRLVSWQLWGLGLVVLLAVLLSFLFQVWSPFSLLWSLTAKPMPKRSSISIEGLGFWNKVSQHMYDLRATSHFSRKTALLFLVIYGIGLYGIGFVTGYQTRTVVQASNTDTWAPVHILRAYGDGSYLVRANGDSETTKIHLCSDSAYAKFEPGSWLKFMTFERRSDCLSFAGKQLGWRSLWDDNGNPIITKEIKINE